MDAERLATEAPPRWGSMSSSAGSGVSSGSLRVRIVSTAISIWIELDGEADVSNHGQLRAALFAPDLGAARRIYLDLRRLTFCDTAGCSLMLLFNAEARIYGRHVKFLGPRPGVRKVLDILAQGDRPTYM